jgi:hypothetical protein
MDDSILGHDGALRVNRVPTFRRNILSFIFTAQKVMTYPVTQRSVPELGNVQPQRCENVKIRADEKFENVNSKTVE